MADDIFDLIVIGGGPGGYTGAIRAAQLGMKVACVERESQLGGTCLRVGCIPSKALLESSHHFMETQKHFAEHGIIVGDVRLDLAAMHKRKSDTVRQLGQGIAGLFKKNKVTNVKGEASFVGPAAGGVFKINVQGAEPLHGKRVLIATGSKEARLPGVELDGDRIGTSTEALAYDKVPENLVVIGAGAIGLEMGSVWLRLGAKVTVLEYLDRILPGMDTELAAQAQRIFAKQGLQFRLGAKVQRARVQGNGCQVEVEGAEPIACDRVLMAVGRVANTDNLGLQSLGIALDQRGRVPVNDHFETSVAGVFAIGDVIVGPMLAHKAEEEAVSCTERLATGYGHVDYDTIPLVVYTSPEVAAVGFTEEQLKQKNIPYRKGVFPFSANARAKAAGDTNGFVKMLAHQQTDRILGVHALGRHASEMIAEAGACMAFGASSEDVARVCHAHPTLAEAFKEAALAVDGRTLNM